MAFSVTNVCGFAHFMGLTIEIVTSIILILSVGLALDYAAHISVYFLCLKSNDRKARTVDSLAHMGPPVFNGGFSTFLAFLLLAWSDSYVFTTFFKDATQSLKNHLAVFQGPCLTSRKANTEPRRRVVKKPCPYPLDLGSVNDL